MSLNRRISWTSALRDMRNDRVQLPAGFLSARALVECFVKTRRPLVVAGKFDRAAKAHQLRTGSTWAAAMSVSLKAAWQVAKTAQRAAAH